MFYGLIPIGIFYGEQAHVMGSIVFLVAAVTVKQGELWSISLNSTLSLSEKKLYALCSPKSWRLESIDLEGEKKAKS